MKKHKKDYLNKILWIGTILCISYIVYICIGANRSNLVYEKEEQKEREESGAEGQRGEKDAGGRGQNAG